MDNTTKDPHKKGSYLDDDSSVEMIGVKEVQVNDDVAKAIKLLAKRLEERANELERHSRVASEKLNQAVDVIQDAEIRKSAVEFRG